MLVLITLGARLGRGRVRIICQILFSCFCESCYHIVGALETGRIIQLLAIHFIYLFIFSNLHSANSKQ